MIASEFAGLRNDIVTERFGPRAESTIADLSTALNVTIDDSNNIARRPGATLTIAGSSHSLWSNKNSLCFYVDAGLLKQVHPDWTTTTLRTGMADYPISYAQCGDRVYYTNGVQNGVIEAGGNRTFGLTVPSLFAATNVTGDLENGQYIYSMSYVRSDGQESGVGAGMIIDITTGGISFTNIPVSTDPDVAHKILYVTSANGTVMYEVEVLDNATTSYTLTDASFEVSCETVHMCEPPLGHLVCEYFGHLLIADDNVVYRSQAYGPELFDLTDFLAFEDRITMLAPTASGIYVGTTREIGFIGGTDPDEFSYTVVGDYGVIEGSLTYTPTHHVSLELPESMAALFLSTRGICMGLPGGQVVNITDARYDGVTANRGASVIQQIGGSAVFITTTN